MVLAGGPDFVEQVSAGCVGGAVKIVRQAAVFFARWCQQGAEFGFE